MIGAAVQTLGGSRSDDEEELGVGMSADEDDDGEDDGGLDTEARADPVENVPAPSPRATPWPKAAPGTAPRRRSRTTSSASTTSTLPPYAAPRSRTASPPRATLRTAAATWFPDGLVTAARVHAALRPPTTSPGGLRPVIPIPQLVATLVAVATVATVTVARVLAAAARSGAPVAWSTPTADRVLRFAAPFATHLPARVKKMVCVDGPRAQAVVAIAVAVLDGAVAWGWAVEEEVERAEKALMLGAAAW
ncbi:hypothetical protein AMAG_20172 [Allomyces macrogynus ATCC 38327]|uniref:Uncharacterized protein n=1 Tax=Allomyces macrogynus (strain ATCC 38327) TaxID=578462 RepID=A0A0L0T7J5_ALLM3|nr:hypothetical protein AMAG_20172 [Allomyces macrogynus ATCC 38327]|eukprot:KNE70783.1 hypothetical protein AMAG_20172 [Allomyces macrogynus ATCC 38327]